MNESVLRNAAILLEYHKLNHALEPADCILGFGTNDDRVAERAAELFLQGLAPVLLFSGGVSSWTAGLYDVPEAVHFARIAVARGVPESSILIEDQAPHTGGNVMYSRVLLEKRGINVKRAIVVQKPYMERRSFATFKKRWPGPDVRLASPKLTLDELPLPHLPMSEVINIMVGDFDRILKYPALGFQIAQEVTEGAMRAFQELAAAGYKKYLVPEAR